MAPTYSEEQQQLKEDLKRAAEEEEGEEEEEREEEEREEDEEEREREEEERERVDEEEGNLLRPREKGKEERCALLFGILCSVLQSSFLWDSCILLNIRKFTMYCVAGYFLLGMLRKLIGRLQKWELQLDYLNHFP